jgi:hypothetical protein
MLECDDDVAVLASRRLVDMGGDRIADVRDGDAVTELVAVEDARERAAAVAVAGASLTVVPDLVWAGQHAEAGTQRPLDVCDSELTATPTPSAVTRPAANAAITRMFVTGASSAVSLSGGPNSALTPRRGSSGNA